MKKCNHHLKKKQMKKIFLMLSLAVFAFSCDNATENKAEENKENVQSCEPACTKACCAEKTKETSSCEPGCAKACCADKAKETSSCEPGCTKACCA
ncbi:MAG: hypothetical protein CL846_00500 [Crocinitomicaceae bacterium]|nr:hypothetical protein [Crocinitomicaceae bacterium]